jgi:hypothetical protein
MTREIILSVESELLLAVSYVLSSCFWLCRDSYILYISLETSLPIKVGTPNNVLYSLSFKVRIKSRSKAKMDTSLY